jgi:hypothetical protein
VRFVVAGVRRVSRSKRPTVRVQLARVFWSGQGVFAPRGSRFGRVVRARVDGARTVACRRI